MPCSIEGQPVFLNYKFVMCLWGLGNSTLRKVRIMPTQQRNGKHLTKAKGVLP